MASTKYSIVSSYQLMENHIAAAVLDSASGFSAYLTPAQATVLLSIGNDTIFRASVETAGTQSGWTVTDISPLLSSKYPSGTHVAARSFAASSNIGNGGFAILLAVTVTQTSGSLDEVWLLTGPLGTDASSWLIGGASINWTKLAYDAVSSPPIQAITAGALQVTGLYLESGLEKTDDTLALATVADPAAPGELRCFLLNLASGASPTWTYYQQEQNIGTANLSLVPGRISSDASWGLYKLYTLHGTPSLTYLPIKGAYGPPDATLFTVPAGASAIASLVYQPNGTTSYTDLFAAADGFIGYFPYNQGRPHQATQLITSSLVTGVTQLHAVNCDGTVVVWGLNGAGQVFYTTAPLAQRSEPSAWQTPIALLSDTTDIAALAGGPADAISLFAVAPLGGTTATGNTGSGLIQLGRNASTGAWLSSVHPLPSTSDCITLKTYTTRVLVVDSNNVPQTGTAISATVSADCSLIINGMMIPVSSSDTLSLTTDTSGYVSFIHAVSSLATPSLTLALPDGSSSTIDPTGAVVTSLAGITSPDHLTSATYVDANGKTQNLVASGTSFDAVSGVVTGLQAISAKLPSLPRAAAFNAMPQARSVTVSLEGGLLSDLGDLVQWIGNVVDDVANIVFNMVGDVVHFVVTIAEDVFTAIVNTVEDALHAITALFKWIGAEIEAVFRWLGFLFDWSDFIAVKDTLKSLVNQSLTSLITIQSGLQTSGDAWFANARANILPRLSSLPMAKPGNQAMQSAWATAQPTPPPVGSSNTDLRSDTRLGWLKDRVNTPPSAASSNIAAMATDSADPTAPLLAAIENLISDVLLAFKTAFVDIGQLVSGEMSASDFFSSMLAAVELLGLDALQTVFDALMSALGAIASTVQTAFNMPIEIPILSALYRAVTGSDLTMLDVICLIFGIGVTLVYKIATDESPATPLAQAANPTGISQALSSLTSALSPPSADFAAATSLLAKRESSATVAASDESPDALQKITGTLLIIQSLTLSVDGGADIANITGLSNLAFTADLTGRFLRGILEIVDDGEQMEESGTQIKVETVWSMCLLGTTAWMLNKEGVTSDFVKKAGEVDNNVSLVWGIWHLVNIHEITSDGGSCPVGLTGEAVLELLEPFQAGATEEKQPEAAVALLVLRAISAVVAGVARF